MTDYKQLNALGPEPLPETGPTGDTIMNVGAIQRHRLVRRALEPTDEELMALAVAVFDDPCATDKDYARAVLARWGRPKPQPTDGEVAELVAWLLETGNLACQADPEEGKRYWSAADLLERLRPTQPVPVSERLPGPEDCDAKGRCWWHGEGEDMVGWTYQDSEGFSYYRAKYWLPANALPLPS